MLIDAIEIPDIKKLMEDLSQPNRILIATAGFGDGHNSAAHNLAKAFENKAEAEVIDPCAIGAPFTNNQLRKFYRFITTHTPKIWYRIYKSVENRDFSKQHFRTTERVGRVLHEQVDDVAARRSQRRIQCRGDGHLDQREL